MWIKGVTDEAKGPNEQQNLLKACLVVTLSQACYQAPPHTARHVLKGSTWLAVTWASQAFLSNMVHIGVGSPEKSSERGCTGGIFHEPPNGNLLMNGWVAAPTWPSPSVDSRSRGGAAPQAPIQCDCGTAQEVHQARWSQHGVCAFLICLLVVLGFAVGYAPHPTRGVLVQHHMHCSLGISWCVCDKSLKQS